MWCDKHIVVDFASIPAILSSFFLLSNAILLGVYFLYTENIFFHLSMNYLILTDSKKILNQFNGLHYWPTNSEIIESLFFFFWDLNFRFEETFIFFCLVIPWQVNASDVIILEGILVFHDQRVRNLMNMKIFVDAGFFPYILLNFWSFDCW